MARVQYNYKSQSVGRNVNISIFLPTDDLSFFDPEKAQQRGYNPVAKLGKTGLPPGHEVPDRVRLSRRRRG